MKRIMEKWVMTLKKFQFLAASAVVATAFVACDNASSSPDGLNDDLSAVNSADGAKASTKQSQEVSPVSLDETLELNETSNIADEVRDTVVQTVDNYALCMESSACVDSVINILFPNGIDIDTARHDPDSVGVWHFYDPRGTHDNPNFAYGEMTDPRDGIVYKTTTIGGQVWMAENLNYFDIEGAPSSIKNDWCYWDKSENCESAGRLYTWTVAKRVCPEGWRLPTNEDWTALLTAVGADTLNPIAWTGANVLKSMSGWENSGSGTDDFGFTALPAGKAFFNKTQSGFTNHGCSSYMWSATEADLAAGGDTLAFSVELNCSNELAIVNTVKKYSGFSIRCVKD